MQGRTVRRGRGQGLERGCGPARKCLKEGNRADALLQSLSCLMALRLLGATLEGEGFDSAAFRHSALLNQ
jgi:hypothetical protein